MIGPHAIHLGHGIERLPDCREHEMVERKFLAGLRRVHLLAQLHERADLGLDRQIEMRNLLLGLREALGNRALQAAGLEVGSITDVTPQAHNGCRPPKRRRV